MIINIISLFVIGILSAEEISPSFNKYKTKEIEDLVRSALVELNSRNQDLEKHALSVACDLKDVYLFYVAISSNSVRCNYNVQLLFLNNIDVLPVQDADLVMLLRLENMKNAAILYEKSGREEADPGGEEGILKSNISIQTANWLSLRLGVKVDENSFLQSAALARIQDSLRILKKIR